MTAAFRVMRDSLDNTCVGCKRQAYLVRYYKTNAVNTQITLENDDRALFDTIFKDLVLHSSLREHPIKREATRFWACCRRPLHLHGLQILIEVNDDAAALVHLEFVRRPESVITTQKTRSQKSEIRRQGPRSKYRQMTLILVAAMAIGRQREVNWNLVC
jgi:hypothetical protein